MAEYQMISPSAYIYDMLSECHTVYGWLIDYGPNPVPIVGNPDGPGIGPWHLFHGEDPWTTSLPS